MAVAKQFQQLVKITNGTTAETDVKLSDPLAMQHIDITSGANSLNQISLAQSMCQPVAVTPNSTPSGGAYTATCSNYPDFSLTYTDKNGNTHYLVGMKVRVIFTKGITYGSVSGGTYPTLNINSSGAIPLLAQGKTMAAGAAVNNQSLELTLIPYGNGVAWDADSNVRESTSDYTIYTDGTKTDNQYIKIKTVTGTTSGGGQLIVPLDDKKQIISVICTSNNDYYCIPSHYQDTYYVYVFNAFNVKVESIEVTVKIAYI